MIRQNDDEDEEEVPNLLALVTEHSNKSIGSGDKENNFMVS